MKRATMLIGSLLLLTPNLALSQTQQGVWAVLPHAPEANIRHEDIYFPTRDTGWIVGSGGVFKTTDGGATWNRQTIERNYFRSTGFADEQVGWIGTLTQSHILYETRDGGQTWSEITDRISGPLPTGICGLWVVNDQLIYGVGRYNGPANFIKSTDGGLTWTSKDMSAYAATLIDVFFFDENTGIAVGGSDLLPSNGGNGSAVVLRTEDGGETWSVRHTSSQTREWGWKISFPTPETGYISVESFDRAKVLKTADGGLTWEEHLVSEDERLQAAGFVTETLGWVGARGVAFGTEDGGVTWSPAGFGAYLNRIRVLGDSLAYAVGKQAYMYRIDKATNREQSAEAPRTFHLEQNYPNPFNPATTITYTLNAAAPVRLTVLDLLGREVKHLVDQPQGPGQHRVVWDGTNERHERVGSGVYLYRLTVGEQTQTRRLLLVK